LLRDQSGIVFAVVCGLDLPYELDFYWFEHYIGAFINPLLLCLMGRYHAKEYLSVYYRIYGFAFFSIYHRAVLFPMSMLTWANLDQTLCHAETDPFYPTLGKWYLLAADGYLGIGSSLAATVSLIVAAILEYIRDLIFKKNVRVKEE